MIQVQQLSFTYPASPVPAVRSISFAVREGEIFGLLGPSGAGKSTTQKILIGLLKGYDGQVALFGRDLRTWGQDYYEHVGISFELPNHYLKLTALENLAYFRTLYSGERETAAQVLEWVGLAEHGDKRVSQYSKGMKNRLNVARALLHRPKLLFLDEPTAGLDPTNARRIQELIQRKRAEGTTIFLTTHDMKVAETLCDRVAFIVEGEVKLIDSPRALKLRHGQRLVRVEYGENGHTAQQEYPLDGLADNRAFLDLLRREPVQTIHTQETTLEEIFINVTGRRLT